MNHSRLSIGRTSLARRSALLLVGSLLFVGSLAHPAAAKEEVEEFLARLGDKGYGEVTLEYLDYLKRNNQLPENVAANWDLYQARGWRLAINEGFNAKEKDERTAKAKSFLDKYLKEHPDSPEVGSEVAEWGDVSFKRGLLQLGQARLAKEPEKKAPLIAEARASFDEARPRFTQSVATLTKKLETVQAAAAGANKAAAARAQANLETTELLLTDAQLKLAKLDFFVAQTYADDPAEASKNLRTELLQRSGKQFNDIYQRYRTVVIGLLAHTFEGKTYEELGDVGTARELYEEVLALEPTDTKLPIDLPQQNMFCQVEYFSQMITLKIDGVKVFLPAAQEWLKTYEKWKRSDGYQGISLEVAKALIAGLDAAPADKRVKIRKEAEALLKDMGKIPSEHHEEAKKLLAEMRKEGSGGGGGVGSTYEEAIANGDDAADNGKWEEAINCYENARELAGKPGTPKEKTKEMRAAIAEKLETCRYNEVYQLYSTDREDAALGKILDLMGTKKINAKGETAGKLAALRVYIILKRYGKATDPALKSDLLDQLSKAAAEVIEGWPDKASADDARIALAQASMVQGKTQEGVEQLESVNPRSDRYANALSMAAQGHLRLWKTEKDKGKEGNPATAKAEASKAIADLEKSVALQSKAVPAGQGPPPQLVEAQLLIGQVYLEMGEPKKASEVLQPLVDAVKAAKPAKLDGNLVKLFNTAVRASVATGDMAKGGETATLLTDLGEDSPEVNSSLMGFAQMVDREYRAAFASLLNAKTENNIVEIDAYETRLKGTQDLLANLVGRLATRQNIAPKGMIVLGDIAARIGKIDIAADVYNRILTKSTEDENFAQQCGKDGLIRVRSQLVDLLGQTGKFAEGVQQADALITEVPKALEPLMTKGRLLQAWAEKDASKFPEAVSHWSTLRTTLGNMKKKPPEYYEVNLNVAKCLLKEAKQNNDKTKAIDAQKVLNALLIPSPNLDGPDTVAKYKEVLKQCKDFAEPAAK